MAAGQSGRDAGLGDGCFAGYYALDKLRQAVDELRQSGRGRAARARAMRTSENGRRMHLPRTLVNKGKKGSTKVEVVSSGS